ncbi:hypothetical protein GCM10020254_36230 [Streptomyces goshikiensis]
MQAGVRPPITLGGVGDAVRAVARVEAAGGVRQVEVPAGAQPGALFEDRPQVVLGDAGVDGGFEDDGGVRAQPGGEGAACLAHGGQVERAVGAELGGGRR